jgi:hypothetical protein
VRNATLSATIALMLALGSGTAAQQATSIRRAESAPPERAIERSGLTFAGAWRPSESAAATATRVVGTVVDIRQLPVANAKVQLRNLDTGSVEQGAETNADGRYAFDLESPGTFVVEMVLVDGYVVALSNAGSVARYETLETVVQLGGRWDAAARTVVTPQNLARYFGVSAQTTMTAVTIGIATTSNISPADPGVPVSP